MGRYDDIAMPIGGQPISSGNFGIKVRDAIIDLDSRLSTLDTSTGTGKAYSTSAQVLSTTAETVTLTIPGMVFVAGIAYEVTMRTGIMSATAGTLCNFHLRKTNAAGALFGEFYRFEGKGTGQAMSAMSSLFVINNTSADITSDVVLTGTSSVAAANAITLHAYASGARYLVIKPAGYASDYVGLGIQVS